MFCGIINSAHTHARISVLKHFISHITISDVIVTSGGKREKRQPLLLGQLGTQCVLSASWLYNVQSAFSSLLRSSLSRPL